MLTLYAVKKNSLHGMLVLHAAFTVDCFHVAVSFPQGGWFAADSPYYGWLVPTVLHSVAIAVLNKVYRSIAVWSTDYENHRYVLLRCSGVQIGYNIM